MKILICLDCDGTLFTTVSLIPPVKVAQAPVPLARLEELEAAGVQFVLVSPSSACDGLPYPRITNPDRSKALLEAAERYPSDFYIYLHCTRQNLEHWIWLNNIGFRSCNSIFQ